MNHYLHLKVIHDTLNTFKNTIIANKILLLFFFVELLYRDASVGSNVSACLCLFLSFFLLFFSFSYNIVILLRSPEKLNAYKQIASIKLCYVLSDLRKAAVGSCKTVYEMLYMK